MYKSYNKSHFEYLLRGCLIENRLGFLSDVTSQHGKTWEHIYEVTTKNRSVTIIIFSSVDMRTGWTRENGADRVRLVMKWKTKNGEVYKRIARHNRLETLFDNVKSTLLDCNVFNLNFKEFNSELPF
jgi:hypothetical protein